MHLRHRELPGFNIIRACKERIDANVQTAVAGGDVFSGVVSFMLVSYLFSCFLLPLLTDIFIF